MTAGIDLPPTTDMRPVDEAAAWVVFSKELDFDSALTSKSPEEEVRDIRRELEISALVWLSERYGVSEYDLESMVEEIGEWRDWPLDEESADSIRTFASLAIEHDDHRPDQVETTVYLHMTREC